jgi:hypothetical protein
MFDMPLSKTLLKNMNQIDSIIFPIYKIELTRHMLNNVTKWAEIRFFLCLLESPNGYVPQDNLDKIIP